MLSLASKISQSTIPPLDNNAGSESMAPLYGWTGQVQRLNFIALASRPILPADEDR